MANNTLMELLFGEYALVATILAFVVLYVLSKLLNERPSNSRLPPWAPRSLFQNIKVAQNQKGLTKVSYPLTISAEFKDGDFGRTTHGATFRMALPLFGRILSTTDYELARLILQGNSSEDLAESEKTHYQRNVNFVDRKTYSLLTHLTSNTDRDRARKALAPCFSTSNLQLTWPYIEAALQAEFASLRSLSKSGEEIDCKKRILQFFLGVLGRSAFGVEFTMDGTENENNINGLEYLEAQDAACSSRVKELSMPLRRYFFWNKDVQKGHQSCETLKRISAKILKLHNEKINEGSTSTTADSSTTVRRHSLIEHISKNVYPTEMARLSDLNIITFAGHDTTGYTFCFLLMELARNPLIKARLLAEIATVMPSTPLGKKSTSAGTSSYQHGDKNLLSAICGLEYLNWCIKETMRLWPIVGMGGVRDINKGNYIYILY